jgi:hypothetical protein
MRRWRAAIILFGLGIGWARAAEPDAALRAYADHDYAAAHAAWLKRADTGDAEAAFQLGLLADLGEGMPSDPVVAYCWYQRAADAGHAAAEFNVAVMQDSGRGVRHDTASAAGWYARAAARGNARAQYNLGLLYNDGDGVPRNPEAARAWFRMAATGGLQAASAKLEARNSATLISTNRKRDDLFHPALPVLPHDNARIGLRHDPQTELVWLAPAETMPVDYFLQVVAKDNDVAHEIYAGYLDVTSALVKLDVGRHAYAWRVYTVSPGTASYTVSSWQHFST